MEIFKKVNIKTKAFEFFIFNIRDKPWLIVQTKSWIDSSRMWVILAYNFLRLCFCVSQNHNLQFIKGVLVIRKLRQRFFFVAVNLSFHCVKLMSNLSNNIAFLRSIAMLYVWFPLQRALKISWPSRQLHVQI